MEKAGYTTDAEYRADDITKVVMVRAGSLEGRLVDNSGKPVKGVTLQIRTSDWGINTYHNVTTDDQGSYTFQDLYPTTYNINIDQYADLTAAAVQGVVVRVGETTKALDMVAVPGTFVSGRVIDAETGKPIATGRVQVMGPMTGGRNSMFFYNTDGQGRFRFRAYPGKMRVSFVAREGLYRFDYPSEELNVSENGVSSIVLKARAAKTIAGRVVDQNDKPVAGAVISVDGEYGTQATTDDSGRFTAMVAPENRQGRADGDKELILSVASAEDKQGIYVPIDRKELPNGEDLTIKLKPARRFTLVIRDSQGKPLSGAEAQLIVCFSSMAVPGDTQIADENGQAVFDVYEGGSYMPTAKLEGYYYAPQARNLRPVGSKDWTGEEEITMEPATRAQTGKVVDEDGNPVVGVTVRVDALNKSTRTDAEGRFVLEGMPDTNVDVIVQRGSSYGSQLVNKDSGDVTIEMRKY